ncbi:MAG: cation:proton antiporter [Phycisphaerales bacterium]
MTMAAGGIGTDVLAILVCAGLVPLVLRRLRVALIPGYLLAGVLIGPVLGVVSDADRVAGVASLATVLLMFSIGLHFDFHSMKSSAKAIVGIGAGSTVVSSLLIGATGLLFGLSWQAAACIGMALAMSSTAAVLKLLQQRRELHRPHGRLSFGILLVQDLAVVVVLAIIPLLASSDAGAQAHTASLHPAIRVVVVGLLILLGRLVLPRLMHAAARAGGGELVLVMGAAVALGAAVATKQVGLSEELGAFVAGLMLATSPFRHQLSGQLAPLRDLFMAVFFTAVGLQVSPSDINAAWWVVGVGAAALLLCKGVSIGFCSWALGASPAVAVRTGLSLAQAGEFSLIVLMVASSAGVVDDRQRAVAIAIVFVSLLVTPGLVYLSGQVGRLGGFGRMAPWIHRTVFGESEGAGQRDAGPGHAPAAAVIIAGFGPVGRACADRLDKAGVRYTIIEMNPRTVKTQAALGRSIVYGDATNPHVLESAGLETARAVLLTIPDDEAMVRACRAIRSINPEVFVAARSSVLSRALEAKSVGANLVMVDEIAAARAMADQVVEELHKYAELPAA